MFAFVFQFVFNMNNLFKFCFNHNEFVLFFKTHRKLLPTIISSNSVRLGDLLFCFVDGIRKYLTYIIE